MAVKGKTLSNKIKQYLHDQYYNPSSPGAFSGLEKFYKIIREEGKFQLNKKDVERWLQGQDTYTVHRPVRRKFKRNRVIVSHIDSQWDGDLMDMSSLAKYNNHYRYILLLIDIFSRFVWAVPLKNKSAIEVVKGLKRLFDTGRKPKLLRTDRGREFVNKAVKDFLNLHNVKFFTSHNETKANFSERAIKTVKGKLFKYLYANQTFKYYKVLDSIVNAYNNSYHSSIKMKPGEVDKNNESALWKQQYLPPVEKHIKPATLKRYKFSPGDYVRISFLRKTFSREYDQKWSDEIFKVTKRFRREGIPLYKLNDFNGEHEIQGTFYQQELQKIDVPGDKVYKIEKILKSKTVRGKRLYLVKWMGWPKDFNSYVSAKDLKNLKNKV